VRRRGDSKKKKREKGPWPNFVPGKKKKKEGLSRSEPVTGKEGVKRPPGGGKKKKRKRKTNIMPTDRNRKRGKKKKASLGNPMFKARIRLQSITFQGGKKKRKKKKRRGKGKNIGLGRLTYLRG